MTGGTGFSISGLMKDRVVMNAEMKRGNRVLEDATEQNWEAGRVMTLEITIDEVNTADLALIEACTALTILFTKPNKTLTVAAAVADTSTLAIFADVVDGKTKITVIKTAKIGSAWTDVFTYA